MKRGPIPSALHPVVTVMVAFVLPAAAVAPACTHANASAPSAPSHLPHTPASVADGWSSLSWEERHDQMTWLVHPNMAKLFQRFEGTAYPELTCRTCHGANAEQVQYKMPNGLPPLDPANMPDPKHGPDAAIAKFMYEEVTPRMADLVGVPLGDPRTGRGFGCFSCHPADP